MTLHLKMRLKGLTLRGFIDISGHVFLPLAKNLQIQPYVFTTQHPCYLNVHETLLLTGQIGKIDRRINRHTNLPYCLLPIAHCLLPYRLLPIAYCSLPIANSLLPIAYCLLLIAYNIAYCPIALLPYCLIALLPYCPIAYCLLPCSCCLLPIPYCPIANKNKVPCFCYCYCY